MQQRLDHIHGLRGIAALLVVLQHAAQFVDQAGREHYGWLLDSVNIGRFGVILFFLISGLVVPFSFSGETPVRNFAISRVFRLYPAYWLSMPVLALVAIIVFDSHFTAGQVLSNATMLQGLWGGRNIGPGYWTLVYEMSFYIICAGLYSFRLLGDAALNAVFVLAALIIASAPPVMLALGQDPGFVTIMPFVMAMFFLGMLLRRAFVDGSDVAGKWSLVLVPLAMLVGVLVSGGFQPAPRGGNIYLTPLAVSSGMALPIAAFVLVLWLKPAPPKWVMFLGTISYSLYLFQDVGLYAVRAILPPGDWPVGYVLGVVAFSTLLASAIFRFVEQPMIAMGRRITHRTAAPGGTPAAA